MADITYTRTFTHTDWVDGESIVQASTENGFNARFHGCEQEFDAISATFGQVNASLKNLQQLQFLAAQPAVTVGPNSSSLEFDVEVYDRTPLPANVDKAYFCVIFPVNGVNAQYTFLYRQVPGNQVRVTLVFYNPTAVAVTFAYRVLALATQS